MTDEIPTSTEVVNSAEPISKANQFYRETAPIQEIKKPERETTENPKEFFERFKDTEEYRAGLAKRVNETFQRNPSAPIEKIEKHFLETPEVKNKFFDYYRNKLQIKYNPNYYSPDFNYELKEYFRLTKALDAKVQRGRADKEDIRQYDLDRSRQHDTAAQKLVEDGIMPNFRLARVFVHFIAVSEGYDSYSPGRDEQRRILLLEQQ
jgi:hypothetical protein